MSGLLRPPDFGQDRVLGQPHVLEDELARVGRAQRELAFLILGREARRVRRHDEAADRPRVLVAPVFAQTIATVAMEPLVIHILAPLSTQPVAALPGAS